MIPNENLRTIVSLCLFMHLFCVAAVLSSNFLPSGLQTDLAEKLAPYTKTLHLDANFVPFQLTDGEVGLTRLHQWQVQEVLTAKNGEVLHRFPEDQWRCGFNHQRQDSFARRAGFYAANESLNDDVSAAMAMSLAKHVFQHQNSKAKRLVVRAVRYLSEGDIRTTAADSDVTSVLYEADAWITKDGTLNLLKRMEPRRTAPIVDSTTN